MKITRQADYAVRCVLYLTRHEDAVSMVNDISEVMKIPRSFLAKILQKLVRAKIVKSFRGVKGGFKLARTPTEINLLEVIEAVDGPIQANRCVIDSESCDLNRLCPVHPVWVEIKSDIDKRLRSWDFAKLARQAVSQEFRVKGQ
jgi:Rrf2 family protein